MTRNLWKPIAIAAVVIAAAAVVVALVAVSVNLQRVNQINRDRDSARVAACLSYNRDLAKNVNAVNDQTQALVRDVFTGLPAYKDPTGKALIDHFVDDRDAKFEAVKVPLRDCTPPGIAAFYSEHGAG